MNFNKITLISSALVLMLIWVSCEKEIDDLKVEQINNTNPVVNVQNKNGILVFETKDDLNNHLKWVMEKQGFEEEIIRFNSSLGFVSLNSIYREEKNYSSYEDLQLHYKRHKNFYNEVEYDNSIINEMICPNIYSFVSNKNGIYQVGNVIYRFGKNDKLFEINANIADAKSKLINFNPKIQDSKIKITETIYRERGLKWGQYSYTTAYRDSKHRLVARLKTYTVNGEICFEAVSSTQRRRFGIWIGENLSGDVGVKANGRAYLLTYGTHNNQWYYDYIYQNISGNWQKCSYTVFGFNPAFSFWDETRSIVKVTHTGAGQTIINENIFDGNYTF